MTDWHAYLAKSSKDGTIRIALAASTIHDLLQTAQMAVAARGLDQETYLLPVFQAIFDLYMSRADAAVEQEGEEAYEELPAIAPEEEC